MTVHSRAQTLFGFSNIEGITLGAGEKVDEVTGGVSGLGVDKISGFGDRANEGQAASVYVADFTVGLWQG